MVEKPIRLNVERQSTVALTPGCARYSAHVIVVLRRRAFDGESAKAVRTFDEPSRV
jgi:hypothetical protein